MLEKTHNYYFNGFKVDYEKKVYNKQNEYISSLFVEDKMPVAVLHNHVEPDKVTPKNIRIGRIAFDELKEELKTLGFTSITVFQLEEAADDLWFKWIRFFGFTEPIRIYVSSVEV